jgi:hypothetical protein
MLLYRARDRGRVSAETSELLTPIIRAFEAGVDTASSFGAREMPNHWEVVET